MKTSAHRLFLLACMLATAMQTRSHTPFEAMAGFFDTKKYRDFHITMTTAPDPYFGSVYVTMDHNYSSREKSITVCSDPAPMAELKANLTSDSFEEYGCRLHAYPRAGYALDGFVLKMNYRPGEDMSSYYLKNRDDEKLRSGNIYYMGLGEKSEWQDFDPTNRADYQFQAKTTVEIVAIFREAVAKKVSVTQPGTLAETIEHQRVQEADNLTVSGPINADDLRYLKTMSKKHNLVRLNLSGAQIEEIPSSAFFGCPLYEVVLPAKGLKRIEEGAFDNCFGLASCPIPEGTTVEGEIFHYSLHLPMKLDNDNGSIGHFDELKPIPLAERTDLVSVADQMPLFPGGEQAMLDYFAKNMRYPALAREMEIEGTVIVQFAVERDGRVSTPEVVKRVDRSLDREALRLIGQMPAWKPALFNGKPQAVKMTLPIRFKL